MKKGMKRLGLFLFSAVLITTTQLEAPQAKAASKAPVVKTTKKHKKKPKTISVGSIKTLYGHTYGSKNQKEYNYTVAQAKKYLAKNNPKKHKLDYDTHMPELRDNFTKDFLYYVANYKAIDKTMVEITHWDYSSQAGYQFAFQTIKSLQKCNTDLTVKQTSDLFFVVDYVSRFVDSFEAKSVQSYKNNPRSAYDVMVNKRQDCDSIAHTQQVMFDLLGHTKNKVTGSGDHAALTIYLKGKWRGIGQGNIFGS